MADVHYTKVVSGNRITLPEDIRQTLDLKIGDNVRLETRLDRPPLKTCGWRCQCGAVGTDHEGAQKHRTDYELVRIKLVRRVGIEKAGPPDEHVITTLIETVPDASRLPMLVITKAR